MIPIKNHGIVAGGLRFAPPLLILAIAGYYFWYLQLFAINIPYQDDTLDVLKFVVAVATADNWQSALLFFFEQHNEHRTSASRLIFYSAYVTQGEVNFRTLSLLANIAIPLFFLLLYVRVRQQQYCWLILLTAALLLFQLRAYELALWAQAAFAYYFVFLYGFACIYLLHAVTGGRFVLAFLFALLANFTLASGQLIWLIGVVSLLHQSLMLRTISLRYAVVWILLAVLSLLLWRWNMHSPDSSAIAAQLPDNVLGAPLLEAAWRYAQFFLALLGSAVSDTNTLAAMITGAIGVAALAWFCVRPCERADIRLELCGLFILLSAAAIAWGRGQYFGVEYALISRYSVLSTLLLAITWVLFSVRIKQQQPLILVAGVCLAATYSFYSFQVNSVNLQNNINQRLKLYNQGKYQIFLADFSKQQVQRAAQLGIYTPPPRPQPLYPVTNSTTRPTATKH